MSAVWALLALTAIVVAALLEEHYSKKRRERDLDEWEIQEEYMAEQWQDRAKKLRKST